MSASILEWQGIRGPWGTSHTIPAAVPGSSPSFPRAQADSGPLVDWDRGNLSDFILSISFDFSLASDTAADSLRNLHQGPTPSSSTWAAVELLS